MNRRHRGGCSKRRWSYLWSGTLKQGGYGCAERTTQATARSGIGGLRVNPVGARNVLVERRGVLPQFWRNKAEFGACRGDKASVKRSNRAGASEDLHLAIKHDVVPGVW